MTFIFDAFTIVGVISGICTIIAVLVVLDCCRIRHNLWQKFWNE